MLLRSGLLQLRANRSPLSFTEETPQRQLSPTAEIDEYDEVNGRTRNVPPTQANAKSLQRSLSLHGEFGAFDYGRGHSEFQRSATVHRV